MCATRQRHAGADREALRPRGIAHKRDIDAVMQALPMAPAVRHQGHTLAVGDDCAAIPDGDGYLLFAIEGFINDFVEQQPWFAGYCGVMVNVSDIYAMGGRPWRWSMRCGAATARPRAHARGPGRGRPRLRRAAGGRTQQWPQ
jgi:selenophosphate synthase